jgi:hypothetical protein
MNTTTNSSNSDPHATSSASDPHASSNSSDAHADSNSTDSHGHVDCKYINPHSPSDCYHSNDNSTSCCYFFINISDDENKTFCDSVVAAYDFVPFFVKQYPINGTYINATIKCKSNAEKTCAQAHPHDLYDCRYQGSMGHSCCMFTDNTGATNCILANNLFVDNVNISMWNNTAQCSGIHLNLELKKYIFLLTLLLFII